MPKFEVVVFVPCYGCRFRFGCLRGVDEEWDVGCRGDDGFGWGNGRNMSKYG